MVFSDGGDGGIRTLDLTDANRTLSQLSYAPMFYSLFATGLHGEALGLPIELQASIWGAELRYAARAVKLNAGLYRFPRRHFDIIACFWDL